MNNSITLKKLTEKRDNHGRFIKGNTSWLKGTKGIVKVNSGSFKKGIVPWCKGKKLTEEHKRKVSEKTKIAMQNIEVKNKITGRKHTKEQNENHSKIMKEGYRKGIFKLSKQCKNTSIELKIQNYLKKLNINFFTHQYIKEIDNPYHCDILVPSMNLIIECDGNYWHNYPLRRDIDDIRTIDLLLKGFKVLRLWESEIKNMTLKEFTDKIKNLPKRYEFYFAGDGIGNVHPIIEDKDFTIINNNGGYKNGQSKQLN